MKLFHAIRIDLTKFFSRGVIVFVHEKMEAPTSLLTSILASQMEDVKSYSIGTVLADDMKDALFKVSTGKWDFELHQGGA